MEVSDTSYALFVSALCKPGEKVIEELTPLKAHLWHMASAAHGEAGELFDAIKKFAIYGKELDVDNVLEELGDIEFYLEGLRSKLGITRQQTIAHNRAKLSDRYKSLQYTNEAAIAREDKQ